MGIFEVASMVASLLLMFAAVAIKIATTQFINRMQNSISAVNQTRQKTMGEFRLAQSQKKVAQQNKAMLSKKKAKIQKKISRLKKELGGMKEDVEHRQKMRDTMRGKLIRPTIAGADQEGGEE